MSKVQYIKVKKELGRSAEEKTEMKTKAEEVDKKVDEQIEENVKKGKIEKASKNEDIKKDKDKTPETTKTKMTDEEKKRLSLEYFNKNYIKTTEDKTMPAIEAFNKMKEDTGLKILSFKFMQYLREDGKTLEKKETKGKFYIVGYRRKT